MSRKLNEVTGRYYVGGFTVSIFGGYHFWPIIDPQGKQIATVLGDSLVEEPDQKWTTEDKSRAPADRIVEALNATIERKES